MPPATPVTPRILRHALGDDDEHLRRRPHRCGVCLRDPRRPFGPRRLTAGAGGGRAGAGADDRRPRIGARGSPARGSPDGVYAVPFEARSAAITAPGLVDALFALLNSSNEIEQLAAMDALGLMRQVSAVASLTERYQFYRAGQQARARGRRARGARAHWRSVVDRDRPGGDHRQVGRGPRRHRARGGVCARAVAQGRIDGDHSAGGRRQVAPRPGARLSRRARCRRCRDPAG